MIVLLTDFGTADPYVGQVHLQLATLAPHVRVIDLFHGLPNFAVEAAAHLVSAYSAPVPLNAVVLAVVDPGVGGSRRAIVAKIGGRHYIGPDNGIFEMVARRGQIQACYSLPVPEDAAPTFHGRDVFAPAAAFLAQDLEGIGEPTCLTRFPQWSDDCSQILFIDHYGNAISGVRARPEMKTLRVGSHRLARARTFSENAAGVPFFYENANGLFEIAAYADSAAALLDLHLSDPLMFGA